MHDIEISDRRTKYRFHSCRKMEIIKQIYKQHQPLNIHVSNIWIRIVRLNMWCFFVVFFLGGCMVNEANQLHLPSYIEACRKDDPNLDACALENAKKAIPHILGGDNKYKIPKLNPLELESVSIEAGGNLSLIFSKLKIFGLDTIDLRKIRINLPAKSMNLGLNFEKLNLLGHYQMDGRILVLPLQGNGYCNLTTTDLGVKFNLNYDILNKGGKKFLRIGETNLDLNLKNLYSQFDNLFNGNEELGKNTNKILNEEWKALYEEIKPAISETILTIITTSFRFIEKIPYDEIFP